MAVATCIYPCRTPLAFVFALFVFVVCCWGTAGAGSPTDAPLLRTNVAEISLQRNSSVPSTLPQQLPEDRAVSLLFDLARNLNCSSGNFSGSCQQCPEALVAIKQQVGYLTSVNPLPATSGRAVPPAAQVSLNNLAKMAVLLSLEPENFLCSVSGSDRTPKHQCWNVSCFDALLNLAFHQRHMDQLEGSSSQVPVIGNISSHEIDGVLRLLNRHYLSNNDSDNDAECINGDSITIELLNAASKDAGSQLSAICNVILRHLLKGDCFALSPEEGADVNQLFAQFGTDSEATEDQRMNRTGFSYLIGRLNDLSNECVIVHSGEQPNNTGELDHVTTNDASDHDHGNHTHRKRRHSVDDRKTVSHPPSCLDWKKLFSRFDADHSNDLDSAEFFKLCPNIISEWAASPQHHHGQEDVVKAPVPRPERPGISQAYVYGTLSITVISLCSIVGVVVIPCMTTTIYNYVMVGLVAMGFGILTGDAILHLLPQALGLHATFHEAGAGHSHGPGGEEESMFPPYLAKCVAILGAVYALFLFEGISHAIMPGHSHSHDHGKNDHKEDTEKKEKSPAVAINLKSISQQTLTNYGETTDGTDEAQQDGATIHNFGEKSPVLCCGMKNLAVVVLMGDTIHNFADGLVVGAAFAAGLQGGLSSSLAVLCHELPHELGDFALLLSTGLSKRKVILLNLLSSLSAFIGLYIGVAIGSDEVVVQWTLAVTAGMFLFVGLGNMMPELKMLTTNRPWTSALIQNIAVLIGMGFTLLMALFEKNITL